MSTITRMELLGGSEAVPGPGITIDAYASNFPTWKAEHTELNEEKEQIRESYLASMRALKKAKLDLEKTPNEDLERHVQASTIDMNKEQIKWDQILARIKAIY